MVRFMADAIDCSQFPRGAIGVPGHGVQPVALRAGYINGRWPTAIQCGTDISIDVNGSRPDADVLDIETGDATPDSAPAWVRAHNAHGGFSAVLYCNRSAIHAVANACDAAGLQVGRDYKWWIATLDGTERVPDMTGVAAMQVWGANFFGLNIDLSIVYDDAWHGTGPAPDPPAPPLVLGDDMRVARDPNGTVWLVTDLSVLPIQDPTLSGAAQKVWGDVVDVSMDEINALSADAGKRQMQLGVTKLVQPLPFSDREGGHTADSDDLFGQILSSRAELHDLSATVTALAQKAETGGVDPARLQAIMTQAVTDALKNIKVVTAAPSASADDHNG